MEKGRAIGFQFLFLKPQDYDPFSKLLREDNFESFVSHLDAALGENGV